MRAAYSTRSEPLRVFPAFLQKQWMACRATERSIRLWHKRGTRKTMGKGGLCPLGEGRRTPTNRACSAVSRQLPPFQARRAKQRDQWERVRKSEEQRLEEQEEGSHQEGDHHRERVWVAPERSSVGQVRQAHRRRLHLLS